MAGGERLIVPGSLVIGPKPVASSAPATLVDYLTSIGKASWYGRYLASYGLAPNSDGTGGTVALNGAVGCWAPVQQVGFDHKWIQTVTGNRPAYVLSDSVASITGNGANARMSLSSTTALDGMLYTILISAQIANDAGYPFSHNLTGNALQFQSASAPRVRSEGMNTPQCWQFKKTSGTYPKVRGGWTLSTSISPGASGILSSSNGSSFTAGAIMEIVACQALASDEIRLATEYLAW